MLDLLKALWVLIPIGIYVWYDYMGSRQQKETVTAYFWLTILAVGLAGFLYQVITTGTIPAPAAETRARAALDGRACLPDHSGAPASRRHSASCPAQSAASAR